MTDDELRVHLREDHEMPPLAVPLGLEVEHRYAHDRDKRAGVSNLHDHRPDDGTMHNWRTCANGDYFEEREHTAAECVATPKGWYITKYGTDTLVRKGRR